VKVYGRGFGASLRFILDGNITLKTLNATTPGDESSFLFSAEDLTDGDHQLDGGILAGHAGACHSALLGVRGSLIPLCLKSTPLKVSALLELKIRLGGDSTSSLRGQMQRTYPHKLLLWTILAQRLFLEMVSGGPVCRLLMPSGRV